MKWIKKTNNLRELIQYIKKFDFSQFFKTWVACMKKNWEPISSMRQHGKNINLHSWNSLFKNLNFFRNWFSLWNELINFKAQIACLKNSNFHKLFQTMKRIDQLQSSNILLEKLKIIPNRFKLWKELFNFKTSKLN